MLTLKRCRRLLGASAPASDKDLERLREELYSMAHIALDVIAHKQSQEALEEHAAKEVRRQVLAGLHEGIRSLPEARPYLTRNDLEELEERAAIREFDGGQSRTQAEEGALRDYRNRIILDKP